jgi:hypothetical protein
MRRLKRAAEDWGDAIGPGWVFLIWLTIAAVVISQLLGN